MCHGMRYTCQGVTRYQGLQQAGRLPWSGETPTKARYWRLQYLEQLHLKTGSCQQVKASVDGAAAPRTLLPVLSCLLCPSWEAICCKAPASGAPPMKTCKRSSFPFLSICKAGAHPHDTAHGSSIAAIENVGAMRSSI